MRCAVQHEFIRVAEVEVFESVLEIIFCKEIGMERISGHIWAPLTVSGRLCLVRFSERPHECLMENELAVLEAVTNVLVEINPENCDFEKDSGFSNYGFWQPSPKMDELRACMVLSLAVDFNLADFLVNFCSRMFGRLESFREEVKIGDDLAVNVLGDRIHAQSGFSNEE